MKNISPKYKKPPYYYPINYLPRLLKYIWTTAHPNYHKYVSIKLDKKDDQPTLLLIPPVIFNLHG